MPHPELAIFLILLATGIASVALKGMATTRRRRNRNVNSPEGGTEASWSPLRTTVRPIISGSPVIDDFPQASENGHTGGSVVGGINSEFDHYVGPSGQPSYPPDWEYRRAAVLERDSGKCQVTGCPSRCKIDVHHVDPIHRRGAHRLENLVCLCLAHHALLPDHGLVTNRMEDKRFQVRLSHRRRRSVRGMRIVVRTHFVRHQFATICDCNEVKEALGLECRQCRQSDLRFDYPTRAFVFFCANCGSGWKIYNAKFLPEEIGPILADRFSPTRNEGRFRFDLSLLGDAKVKAAEFCILCAAKGVIAPLRDVSWQTERFKGCPNFPKCRNTNDKQAYRRRRAAGPTSS